jgi:hypothetical protein
VTVCERTGRTKLAGADTLRHPVLPDFAMPINFLFEEPKPKKR